MPADYNVKAWTPQVEREFEYTTSSGAKCMLRKVEMEDLVQLDVVDQIDSLTSLVQTEHIDRVSGKSPKGRKAMKQAAQEAEAAERKAMMQLMKDKERFGSMVDVLDKIIMACVLSPQVQSPWINDPNASTPANPTGRRKMVQNERDAQAAYVDYIDLKDKIAIFGLVFDSMDDLEKFRDESEADLEPLEDESESGSDSGSDDGADEYDSPVLF